jgi:hypothetical protein
LLTAAEDADQLAGGAIAGDDEEDAPAVFVGADIMTRDPGPS